MAVVVLLLFLLCVATSDQHVKTVPPGADVTLRCEAGDDVTLRCVAGDDFIRAVEWTRADLESEYVLFYSDGHSDTSDQHPSFRDRVELVDRELKDGDVSLILKNVNNNDVGTYECRVAAGGSRRTKRANIDDDPISIINLEVTDSKKENSMGGNTEKENTVDELVGQAASSGVVTVLLLAAAVFVVWRHKRRSDQKSKLSAAVKVNYGSYV